MKKILICLFALLLGFLLSNCSSTSPMIEPTSYTIDFEKGEISAIYEGSTIFNDSIWNSEEKEYIEENVKGEGKYEGMGVCRVDYKIKATLAFKVDKCKVKKDTLVLGALCNITNSEKYVRSIESRKKMYIEKGGIGMIEKMKKSINSTGDDIYEIDYMMSKHHENAHAIKLKKYPWTAVSIFDMKSYMKLRERHEGYALLYSLQEMKKEKDEKFHINEKFLKYRYEKAPIGSTTYWKAYEVYNEKGFNDAAKEHEELSREKIKQQLLEKVQNKINEREECKSGKSRELLGMGIIVGKMIGETLYDKYNNKNKVKEKSKTGKKETVCWSCQMGDTLPGKCTRPTCSNYGNKPSDYKKN